MHRILLLVAVLLLPVGGKADPARLITVQGQGSATARPDMATLTLGVTARAKDAADVMQETSDKTAAVLAVIKRFGIADADVQTSSLNLSPLYDNRSSGALEAYIGGYEASNQVIVRVRDMQSVGELISSALSDGANTMGGLMFGVSDPAPLLRDARADAVADAIERAGVYAKAAGVKVGKVVSISDVAGGGDRPEMRMAARMSAVPIAAGEAEYTARVTLVFEIAK